MNILESLEWRYATKKFDNTTILPNEVIERLSIAFNLTATSYGLQPIKLKIVKNKELQEVMRGASMGQEQVSTASHVLVFCIENEITEAFINSYFKNMKHIRKEDIEGVDIYNETIKKRFLQKTKDQVKDWATKQAYLALGNLLTVCAVEKVDSCPMEGFVPQQIDEILGLEKENLSSVLLLPIGKRASDDENAVHKKVRRPLHSIVELIS